VSPFFSAKEGFMQIKRRQFLKYYIMEIAIRKITCNFLLALAITSGTFGIAYADGDLLQKFNNRYRTEGTPLDSCITCHTRTYDLNRYGYDFLVNGCFFEGIEEMDSDDDGFSNITEINNRSFPGDPDDMPSPGDGDTGCFITTAAYGSPLASLLILLLTIMATTLAFIGKRSKGNLYSIAK
jgi:hypothetical protein